MGDEDQTLEEKESDDRFAEKMWSIFLNFIIMLILLIILSATLFWGDPDLVDGLTSSFSRGQNCLQN